AIVSRIPGNAEPGRPLMHVVGNLLRAFKEVGIGQISGRVEPGLPPQTVTERQARPGLPGVLSEQSRILGMRHRVAGTEELLKLIGLSGGESVEVEESINAAAKAPEEVIKFDEVEVGPEFQVMLAEAIGNIIGELIAFFPRADRQKERRAQTGKGSDA